MATTPSFTFKTHRETGLRRIGHSDFIEIKLRKQVVGNISKPSALSGSANRDWSISLRIVIDPENAGRFRASENDQRIKWKNVTLTRKFETSDVAKAWVKSDLWNFLVKENIMLRMEEVS
jgi:hypothetical protein